MKSIRIAIVLLAGLLSVSCLKHGLEDLETYTGNDIESVPGIYFRYYSDETHPANGEQVIKQAALTVANTEIDAEAGTVVCSVGIPSGFPQDQLYNVSLGYAPGDKKSVIVTLRISTAATIKPLDGAPELGTPGDWSKPNRYLVTAANGDTKEWTVSLKASDQVYTVDSEFAYNTSYGWATYYSSESMWGLGYYVVYSNSGFLEIFFSGSDDGTPIGKTITTSDVKSVEWGGNPVRLTECNVTFTPADSSWQPAGNYVGCDYNITGTLKGRLNSLQNLIVTFTADDNYPAWMYYDPA